MAAPRLVQRSDEAEGGRGGGRQEPQRAEADEEPAERRHARCQLKPCMRHEAVIEIEIDIHSFVNGFAPTV